MIKITRQNCLDLIYDKPELMTKVYSDLNSVIKYIKENELLDITIFYEILRKSYNQKHSKCYGNIVKDIEDPKKVLTTLSALLTQILLYSENAKDKKMFIEHSRFNDILKCLNDYSLSFDITSSLALMKELKTDIKYLESL